MNCECGYKLFESLCALYAQPSLIIQCPQCKRKFYLIWKQDPESLGYTPIDLVEEE